MNPLERMARADFADAEEVHGQLEFVPANRSRSPVLEFDQRLSIAGFERVLGSLSPGEETTFVPAGSEGAVAPVFLPPVRIAPSTAAAAEPSIIQHQVVPVGSSADAAAMRRVQIIPVHDVSIADTSRVPVLDPEPRLAAVRVEPTEVVPHADRAPVEFQAEKPMPQQPRIDSEPAADPAPTMATAIPPFARGEIEAAPPIRDVRERSAPDPAIQELFSTIPPPEPTTARTDATVERSDAIPVALEALVRPMVLPAPSEVRSAAEVTGPRVVIERLEIEIVTPEPVSGRGRESDEGRIAAIPTAASVSRIGPLRPGGASLARFALGKE